MTRTPEIPRRRRSRNRGSAYVFIVGVAMLLSIIALGIVAVSRLQVRAQGLSRDAEEASFTASSAVEHGLATVANNPTWRTQYASGVWTSSIALNRGTFAWKLVDEIDGNLSDNAAQPARLYGKGVVGGATRVYSVLLEVGVDSLAHVHPASWRTELNQ